MESQSTIGFIRKYGLLWGLVATCLTVGIILFDYQAVAFIGGVLLFVGGAFWAGVHWERWFLLLAFCTPLSVDVHVLPGVKLAVVSEMLTIVMAVVGIWQWRQFLHVFQWQSLIIVLLLLDFTVTGLATSVSVLKLVSAKRWMLKGLYIWVYFFMAMRFLPQKHLGIRLLKAYVLGAIIPIIVALVHHSERGFSQASSVPMGRPFFADHTIYAACLAFVLPTVVYYLWKGRRWVFQWLVWLLIGGLYIIGLVYAYSRAAWISVLVAALFAVFLWFRGRWYHLTALLLIGSVVLAVNFNDWYGQMKSNNARYNDDVQAHLTSVTNLQSDASNLERINRWVCAIQMGKSKPILGYGPGTYQFVYDKFQRPEYMTRISSHHGDAGNAHSDYLGAFAEMGWLGLGVMLGLNLTVLFQGVGVFRRRNLGQNRAAVGAALLGIVTIFVHGTFNSFLDADKMSFLVYTSFAIIAHAYATNNKPTDNGLTTFA